MNSWLRPIAILTAVGLMASAGCGGRGVAQYPVQGKVVYKDGSPVTGGVIELQSVDHQPPLNARGTIGPDGTFQLGMIKLDDGAVVGKHRAIVLPPMRALSSMRGLPSERADGDTKSIPLPIATRFWSYDQSGLEITVEPRPNEVTITVERP